jgi:hypothetical protein
MSGFISKAEVGAETYLRKYATTPPAGLLYAGKLIVANGESARALRIETMVTNGERAWLVSAKRMVPDRKGAWRGSVNVGGNCEFPHRLSHERQILPGQLESQNFTMRFLDHIS